MHKKYTFELKMHLTCIHGLGGTEDVFFVFLIYTQYLESNSSTIIHEIKEVFHNNRPQVSTNFLCIGNCDAIVLLHKKSPQGCADYKWVLKILGTFSKNQNVSFVRKMCRSSGILHFCFEICYTNLRRWKKHSFKKLDMKRDLFF